MSVKIITDSAADLPQDIIDDYNIEVLPLLVTYGDEVYEDGVTMKSEQLFADMREGKTYKTAQTPIGDFIELFSNCVEEKTDAVYIGFSSELSGTYQGAVMARNQVLSEDSDIKLDIIDSKCASLGFGMVVYYAARMAKEGKSREEILKAVNFYSSHMEHIFTVDNLEYLYRGGRVSKTSAFVGGLLNIKPILDVEDGKLIPLEKKKGRKRVLKRMVEIMEERGVDLAGQTVAISHGDDLETAQKLQAMIGEKFGTENFVINTIGAAIGAHAGPGTLALFFLNEVR